MSITFLIREDAGNVSQETDEFNYGQNSRGAAALSVCRYDP
jgi:hypothetical protein